MEEDIINGTGGAGGGHHKREECSHKEDIIEGRNDGGIINGTGDAEGVHYRGRDGAQGGHCKR